LPPSAERLQLIARIYDAVLTPEDWPDLLVDIAKVGNAKHTNLILHDSSNPEVTIAAASYDDAIFEEYHERYMASEKPMAINMALHPAFKMITDEELCNWGIHYLDMPIIPFIAEKLGVKRRIVARLHDHDIWFDGLTFFYGLERENMTPAENKDVQFILPHVAKAISVSRPFNMLKTRFQAILSVLDRFHMGVFLLSASSAVMLKNNEASRIVDLKDGIYLTSDGRLKSNVDSSDGALSTAIRDAVSTVNAEANNAGTLLAVPRTSGESAFLIDVSPFSDSLNELGEQFKGGLVLVIDPNNRSVISTRGIDLLFGLSQAESGVCELLVDGHKTEDMADIRGVSIETIRSQIKSVLAKTNSVNRSDVLRRALSLNLPIDPSEEDNS